MSGVCQHVCNVSRFSQPVRSCRLRDLDKTFILVAELFEMRDGMIVSIST